MTASNNSGEPDSRLLESILDSLSREICRPLDRLREDVDRLLNGSAGTLNELEQSQATTMKTLCDDLVQLTRVNLSRVEEAPEGL